jgi:hypothetical protein
MAVGSHLSCAGAGRPAGVGRLDQEEAPDVRQASVVRAKWRHRTSDRIRSTGSFGSGGVPSDFRPPTDVRSPDDRKDRKSEENMLINYWFHSGFPEGVGRPEAGRPEVVGRPDKNRIKARSSTKGFSLDFEQVYRESH